MGASASTSKSPGLNKVFSKELQTVTDIINHVLRDDNKFISEDYNFLTRETCDRYTVVLESRLKHHLKVDVQQLHDSLLMIPKNERLATDNNVVVDKAELCKVIAQHYVKLLYILCLIKYVYNLENGGDYSIAGIIKRNVKVTGGLLEIHFCSLAQKEYDRKDKRVDFGSLKGLQFFVEHFLEAEEQGTFMKLFRMTVARSVDAVAVQQIACHDATLLRPNDYSALYGTSCKTSRVVAENGAPAADLSFDVAPFNPVLSSNVCMSKKKVVVQLGADRKTKALYERMERNYATNLKDVEALLDRIVKADKGKYELRVIDDQQLHDIVTEVKSIVVRFYLGSVLDYQWLLDAARSGSAIEMEN